MRTILKTFIPYIFIKAYRRLLKEKESRVYRGNEVMCPICKSTFISFATYARKRKNARCINCSSLERHRLQFLYLNEKTNLFDENAKLRLLHFAPEKHLNDILITRKNIDYVKCDLSPKSLDFREIAGIQKVDITNIPFKDNSFDVILCNHVLEHIADDRKAMRELYRVLNHGGWGIFQVPIKHKSEKTYEDFSITSRRGREKAFGQYDHVRIYGRDYADRLEDAGFVVIKDDFAKSFSETDKTRFGINPREIIFLCKKQQLPAE